MTTTPQQTDADLPSPSPPPDRRTTVSAPHLTDWATDMADAGLQPYDGVITLDGDDKPYVRLHLAFASDMDDADRAQFVMALSRVVLANL